MRIKRNGPLGGRKAVKSDADKIKYYLVCEGAQTEPIYFEALNRCREKAGVHPRIELIPVERGYSEYRLTNPKTLAKTVKRYLDEVSEGRISYQEVIDWILDFIREQKGIKSPNQETKVIRAFLSNVVKSMGVKLDDTFSVADLESECQKLSVSMSKYGPESWAVIVRDLPDIMEQAFEGYNPAVDKICLIVDRDEYGDGNFTKAQYEDVREICHKEGFDFYPSNPCFEFWLLMHYDDVHTLDKTKLRENPKAGSGKKSPRYTEIAMRQFMPGYSKSNYDADALMEKIDCAVKNADMFCIDEAGLEHTIGSRVGLLIMALRGSP